MTYEEFIEQLMKELAQKSGWGISEENIKLYRDGFTTEDEKELQFVRRTNLRYHKKESDVLMGDYILVTKRGTGEVVNESRFPLNQLYTFFEDGNWEEGWKDVWAVIEENMITCDRVAATGILEQMNDYEAVRERLIIRPLNYQDNRFELKECLYRQVGDIALVLYMILYDSKEAGFGTTKISMDSVEKWGPDSDTIWENALFNTNVMAPPRMYMTPADCVKPAYTKGAFMAVDSKIRKLGSFAPTVTTTRQLNGGIAMFYPGVQERISQMAGGDFYVAFTSIHEAKIHARGTVPPRQILHSLKSVNKAFDPTEILSRKVFYYNAQKKTFTALEL